MPSRSKSKIFSLSKKLRSRSRSVAKKGGRRLQDGGEERLCVVLTSPSVATSAVSKRSKGSPAATAQVAPTRVRGRTVSTPENKSAYTGKSPTAVPQAAARNNKNKNNGIGSTTVTPQSSSLAPPTRESNNFSRCSNTSESSDCNDQFVTAFTRSPPSFDQFDSDMLLRDNGVFPQPTHSRSSSAASPAISTSYNIYSGVGPSHSAGHDSQPSVGLNGSNPDDEPYSIGPNGILWGDTSVNDKEDESANNIVHSQDCYSGSADPPAILDLVEDDDLVEDEEADDGLGNGHSETNKNRGSNEKETPIHDKGQGSEWFDSFANSKGKDNKSETKSRRLVSPSPPPAKNIQPVKRADSNDLAAWGGMTVTDQKSKENSNESDDAFGGNFFKSNGFDSNDEFGVVEDAFFGNSWMDVNGNQNNNANKPKKGGNNSESDPWGEASFVDASFNHSMSNEESKHGPFYVGQKNAQNKHNALAAQPLKVWDGQADGASTALMTPNQASTNAVRGAVSHPLKAPSRSQEKNEKVVVTFDKSLAKNRRSPLIINGQKVSQGSSAVVSTRRSHRRLDSRESQSSYTVGSNSSAVDQILEHYRQKRLIPKDKVSGKATPSGSSSIHSGMNAGSVSVHSGSQFSTPGSSGAGNSVGNGAAAIRGVSAILAPGSASGGGGNGHVSHTRHRRNPSAGSSSHRRSPSGESLSQIIDHLETAAHRTPSPAVGKYYLPNANGFVGVGGMCSGGDDAADHQFLLANIEATIGPRGVAPDMESLSGRSIRSHRSQSQPCQRSNNNRHRPHRSPTRNNNHRISSDTSVDSRASRNSRASRASRNSFRTYQSSRSALTSMSKETQSVANDLFRLEAQLAEVARQQEEEEHLKGGENGPATKSPSVDSITYSTSGDFSANNNLNNTLGAEPVPRPTPFQITAPPGKLGILLLNKSGQKGPTQVSAVRSESVLAGKVHVGDVFVSIDGEDVTRMNSKEITSVMARKADFERVLRFRPLDSSSPQRQEWI